MSYSGKLKLTSEMKEKFDFEDVMINLKILKQAFFLYPIIKFRQ